MTRQEKMALKVLKQKQKEHLNQINQNKLFAYEHQKIKELLKQRQNLIFEIAKQEFEQNKSSREQLEKLNLQLEKELNKINLSLNQIEPSAYCKLCNDQGVIDGKNCSCLNNILSELLIKESGIKIELKSFENSSFEMFSNPNQTKTLFEQTKKWCTKHKDSKIVNWGFFGNTGTGKTHLMLCMADKLIKQGELICFTTAYNLIQNLLSAHTTFDESKAEILEKYILPDVLFIDDLGTEPIYKNVNENYLYLIVNQRMIEKKSIVFSTNLTLEEFMDRYGERIFSRLINKHTSKIVLMDGDDLRLKK